MAGGHLPVYGRDYDSVYAPVADFNIVRLVLILSLQNNWHTRHIDVTAAFLNGDMDREAFVKLPYNLPKKLRLDMIYRLKKALYGLKQAPLQWFRKLRDVLFHSMSYEQLFCDGSIFKGETTSGGVPVQILILVYVDDILSVCADNDSLNEAVSQFLKEFKGTDEGNLS